MANNFVERLIGKKTVIKLSMTVLLSAAAIYGGAVICKSSAIFIETEKLGVESSNVSQVETDFTVDGITYHIESGNKVSVVAVYADMEVIDIRKHVEYNGQKYEVGSISSRAFWSCKQRMKVLNLPEEGIILGSSLDGARNLTTINNLDKATILKSELRSFFQNCVNLVDVKLPESLTEIGEEMFFNCASLQSIDIGKNVENIGRKAFCGCVNLETVNIASGSVLKTVGEESFGGCTALEHVNIAPDSVIEKIEMGAFAACKRLKGFVLPRSVKEIGDLAFMDCDALSSVNVREDVKIGRCSFPKSCKVIGAKCVYDESLEEQNKQLEDFVEGVLKSEAEKGRNLNEPVNNEILDRVLYKYAPKTKDGKSAIDVPEVVSQEDFDKGKEGKLVLYRGQNGLKKCGKLVMTSEEANEKFKRGPFYFPLELNGIYCTRGQDHARTYGRTLQFYFKDEPKIITDQETSIIVAFYKYRHMENSLKGEDCDQAPFLMLLKNLGIGTMQEKTFIPRALGYDVQWDITGDGIGRDGDCTKGMLTTQYEVFYRSKLVVCEEDLPGLSEEVRVETL